MSAASLIATCAAGHSVESMGRDESSRGAIKAFRAEHAACTPAVRADYDPLCVACVRGANDKMAPTHAASSSCESGKHPHCTCDRCY